MTTQTSLLGIDPRHAMPAGAERTTLVIAGERYAVFGRAESDREDERRYRYALSDATGLPGSAEALFLLTNPSTADHTVDDPTSRKVASFARRWHCARWSIANLFAERATDPLALHGKEDPIGPLCDLFLAHACHRVMAAGGYVVLGWGPPEKCGAGFAPRFARRAAAVCELLDAARVVTHTLRLTKGGHPGHPLYIPGNAPLRLRAAASHR